ncbi:MAG: hypothetical protein J6L86_01985 [Alphaproteobacteria bacterium]|nr:hypothetical protein [Alphaproteobacteria bacterium]
MKNINKNMLHMKLNSAVSVFAVAAAFSVLLPPSNAFAGVCFLPDCGDDKLAGDIPPNPNPDTEWCENRGYTYYASGKCPQYQAQVGKCKRDDYYLKCDAVTWCKQNGYNTQTCSLPSFVDGQCPNGKPYYKQCKEDRPRACREAGYVNSCSPGRLYKGSKLCQWDSSYGTCCTASPSAGCPSNYGVSCTGGANGKDTCGYTCYKCCDDTCPGRSEKYYSGSKAGKTECGTQCYYCKDCTSGDTSYSGSYAGTSECGTCYYCSDTCRSGQKSVSCSWDEDKVRVSSTECGTGCYECEYNTDCSATDKDCDYGCAYTNSCGKCTRCKSAPPPPSWKYIRKKSYHTSGWCWEESDGQWWHICRAKTYCVNGSTEKEICELSFAYGVGGKASGWNPNAGFKTEAECNAAPKINCSIVGEATLGSCDSSGNKECSY